MYRICRARGRHTAGPPCPCCTRWQSLQESPCALITPLPLVAAPERVAQCLRGRRGPKHSQPPRVGRPAGRTPPGGIVIARRYAGIRHTARSFCPVVPRPEAGKGLPPTGRWPETLREAGGISCRYYAQQATTTPAVLAILLPGISPWNSAGDLSAGRSTRQNSQRQRGAGKNRRNRPRLIAFLAVTCCMTLASPVTR